MVKTMLLAVAAFAIALGAAAWLAAPEWGETDAAADGNDTGALARRLARLEASLRDEMEQRMMLELELLELREQVEDLGTVRAAPVRLEASETRRRTADSESGGEGSEESAPRRQMAERFAAAGFGGTGASGRRIERLIGEGFSVERAQWIEQRNEELRMEALQAQYEAARGDGQADGRVMSAERQLRHELGDADYERYLRAQSRPTSVGVRQVLASSPAATSGLQPGDEIVAYAGERVFSMGDLNELILQGAPGQTVPVDVLRDGQRMQLYMPRGPVGIVGGRGRITRRP